MRPGTVIETSDDDSSGPAGRTNAGMRRSYLAVIPRRCSREPVAALPDAALIRVTRMAAAASCSCSSSLPRPRSKGPKLPSRATCPHRAKQQAPRWKPKCRNNPKEDDLTFFVLCPSNS